MSQESPVEKIRGEPLPATATEAVPHEEEEPAPVGTLFIMMLFLVALVALWGLVYWMLLTR